ncbi:zinc finger protein 2 homolog [Xyrichtys novacula]|uniref:Zinc finger protein 2 homolog n=1 Tax=Xyrichtys novacula TaxID=13765 RepID=A0AAV1GUT1_XYRNO|nr:zinc finger protein 2 homolog [Xyrichtys novacula]
MSQVQMLRDFVNQRLTAAAEEIFEVFGRTIAEYEEQLYRSKEENEQQQRLLDTVYSSQLLSSRTDIQELSVLEEKLPSEQDTCSQEDTETPCIKKEQEGLWSSQEGEQHQGLEIYSSNFQFTSVPVKNEDDEENSPDHHERETGRMKTGNGGGDRKKTEQARKPSLERNLQPVIKVRTVDTSEPGTEEKDYDWMETREHYSSLKCVKYKNSKRPKTNKKPHSCPECGKTFSRHHILIRHMRIHTGEKPFSCSWCGKRFNQKGNLTNHLVLHTKEKPFKCSECGKSFSLKGNLTKHMLVHTREKPFSCSECGKRFSQKRVLINHMVVHTRKKPHRHSAEISLILMETEEPPIEQHEWSHNQVQKGTEQPLITKEQEGPWSSQAGPHGLEEAYTAKFSSTTQSEDCDKKPQLHQSETEHMQTRNGGEDCRRPGPAKDPDCEEDLQTEVEVKTEDFPESVTENGVHDWWETGEQHPSFGIVKYIKHKEPGTDESLHSCPECDNTFREEHALTAHMNIHMSEKSFCCSWCGKEFNHRGHLNKHMILHTGEKPFSCSICGKRFNQKGNVTAHMVLHTKERPFSCSECGKRFNHRGNLSKHMFVHTGEKPFSCPECGKRFTQKGNLTAHMILHTEERPFRCSECGKGFSQKGNFTKHMLAHRRNTLSCS